MKEKTTVTVGMCGFNVAAILTFGSEQDFVKEQMKGEIMSWLDKQEREKMFKQAYKEAAKLKPKPQKEKEEK